MRHFAATIYTRGTALAVAVMAATLFGCSGMAHLDPEPEPTSEELLRGSWHITVPWTDGDEELGVEYHVLTFTKDRWIQHRDRRDLDGQEVASWARSGTWSMADGTITRTWYESDNGTLRHVDKDYRIEDDMLVVDRWTSRVPINDTWTYKRGPSLTKEDLFGQWRTSGTTDGGRRQMTLTLTIGESCSYRRDFVELANDEASFIDAIGESCEVDIERLLVSFVISRVDVSPTSVWNAVGQPLTFAVAPRARSAGLAVSGFWNEQVYDYEAGEWQLEPNPDYPYGGYNMFLEKVADAESALD